MRQGIDLSALQPANATERIQALELIINGTEDERTTREDAKLLYENVPQPKVCVWFEGVRHGNLFDFDRKKYEEVLVRFLRAVDEAHTLYSHPDDPFAAGAPHRRRM